MSIHERSIDESDFDDVVREAATRTLLEFPRTESDAHGAEAVAHALKRVRVAVTVGVVSDPAELARNCVTDFIDGRCGRPSRRLYPNSGAPRLETAQNGWVKTKPGECRPPTPFVWRTLQARKWLHAEHYIRSYLTVTAAPPGMGKTTSAIVEILEMITGWRLSLHALRIGAPAKPICVWYVNGEDPRNEIELRFQAAMQHFRVTPEDVAGKLYIDTGREHDFIVARDDAKRFAYATPIVGSVIEGMKRNGVDCLVADPAVAFHRVPENDNTKIEVVASAFKEIADKTNAAVELIAHTRKTNGEDVGIDDVRGGNALIGAGRSVRVANFMTESEGKRAGLLPGAFNSFFRIDNVKSNMTARATRSVWRRMVSVRLPVEDEDHNSITQDVGTCEAWFWPEKEEDERAVEYSRPTAEQREAILRAFRPPNHWMRYDQQSPEWAGRTTMPAVGLDPKNTFDRRLMSEWLKMLIEDGDLVIKPGEKANRSPCKFVTLSDRTTGDEPLEGLERVAAFFVTLRAVQNS
jgi:AAA domain